VYRFHVNIFAEPREHSFAATWEEVAVSLEKLPRMIFEPDGSFVVSGGAVADRWQVDGHLFDFAGQLYRLELHGDCPQPAFDELLRCVGWPGQALEFETVHDGLTLSEASFRAQAGETS
jgi:hypothetical protein